MKFMIIVINSKHNGYSTLNQISATPNVSLYVMCNTYLSVNSNPIKRWIISIVFLVIWITLRSSLVKQHNILCTQLHYSIR